MLAAICLLSPSALAQTSECKTIPAASARLACYDKAALEASAGCGKTRYDSRGRPRKTRRGKICGYDRRRGRADERATEEYLQGLLNGGR
jgi:hypothetical protein